MTQIGTGYDTNMPMKQKLQFVWKVVKQAGIEFGDNVTVQKAAALAYYTIFAMAPMILVILTLGDLFYGREAIEGGLFNQIKGFVGAEAAASIQEIIRNAAVSRDGTFATIVGVGALIFSATGVFTEIQGSINQIWCIKTKPKRGWLKFIKNRFLSFSMLLGLGFILIVSLVVSTVLESVLDRLLNRLPDNFVIIGYVINLIVTFLVISLLFSIIFKWLPDAEIEWRDVRSGAFATAGLFMLGKFLIGLYLNKSNPGGAYGTAGSLVIVLLWVYYSAIILYFGATFTKSWAHLTGREIKPNHYAVFVETKERETTKPLSEIPVPDPVKKEEKAEAEAAESEESESNESPHKYAGHPEIKLRNQ